MHNHMMYDSGDDYRGNDSGLSSNPNVLSRQLGVRLTNAPGVTDAGARGYHVVTHPERPGPVTQFD